MPMRSVNFWANLSAVDRSGWCLTHVIIIMMTLHIIILQSEKFRRASKVTTKLASLASEATGKYFKSRIALLESVVAGWGANEEVSLKGEFMHDWTLLLIL